MVMLGSGHRVLLAGGEGVVLYSPGGRGIERETSISWDVPNFEQQLAQFLSSAHQSKSVLVIFDGADQTYRKEENIPKLSFVDQPRFVKRKLELAFPSYPVRAALEIKPAKKVRGVKTTPSYLFVALPETEQLDRIGAALYESGVSVAGFGLLPAESSGLVTELAGKVFGEDKKSRWSVLIGQHETGGLRQVVVKDGNLALTRLTPTSEAGTSGPGWVEEVTREFRATLTYISRFGFSSEDGLDVMVVCGDLEKQFFDPKTVPTQNFKCLNPAEALRAIGARSLGLEKTNFADPLHAVWAGRKSKLNLPIVVPSIDRVMGPRSRARLGSVALALLACGIAWLSLQSYWSYSQYKEETAQKQSHRDMLQREYDNESKVFDSLPVRPEVVKTTLSVKTLLENNTVNLRATLHTLKNALGNDIRLEDLNLEHTAAPAVTPGASEGKSAMFAPPPDPNNRGSVKINFKFTLPEGMLLEQKVTKAEQLATTLRQAFPNYSVSIVSQFGKVSRSGKFTGDSGSTAGTAAGANDFAELQLEGAPL